jgi:hypothetical protein
MPAGLQSDPEVVKEAARATRVEVWCFTSRPTELRFYESIRLALIRVSEGDRTGEPAEGGNDVFFLRFNGKESKFRHVLPPNIIVVEDGGETK